MIRYCGDKGWSIVRDRALPCGSWTVIVEVSPEQPIPVLRELDGDDVDAITQVSTNLSTVRLVATAEMSLGKPIIAIHAATWWHAPRENGITEPMDGFGRLMVEF